MILIFVNASKMINEKTFDDYRRGRGNLTDEEINKMIIHFEKLSDLLAPLGLLFHHSWKEAYNILNDLKSIKEVRKRYK